MEVWSDGGALQAFRRGSIEVWRSGGLELLCRRSDVEEWKYVGRRRAHTYRRGGMEGVLEACCTRSDVEVWRAGRSLSRVDLEVSRYRALEVWSRAANVSTWRHGGMSEAPCRHTDIEVRRSGGMELWTRVADLRN